MLIGGAFRSSKSAQPAASSRPSEPPPIAAISLDGMAIARLPMLVVTTYGVKSTSPRWSWARPRSTTRGQVSGEGFLIGHATTYNGATSITGHAHV
jgi:hypothetical protein